MKKYYEVTTKCYISTGIEVIGITEFEAESKPQNTGYGYDEEVNTKRDYAETHEFFESRKDAERWLKDMESENARWAEAFDAGFEIRYI